MKTLLSVLSTTIFMSTTVNVSAYPVPAHEKMTVLAFENSVISDSSFVRKLGIVDEYRITKLINSSGNTYQVTPSQLHNIKLLTRFGAAKEDALAPPRMLNHFFDVQNFGAPYSAVGPYLENVPSSSLVWSLEPNGEIEDWAVVRGVSLRSDQDLSYRDALGYFSKTYSSLLQFERDDNMGKVFQIMGHLTHHMQDMAQPEHTRDDNHFDTPYSVLNNFATPNFAQAVSPSYFESYAEDNISSIEIAATVNPYTEIDIRRFENPSEFWTNGAVDNSDNLGIAAFTSRNYISQDTNFQDGINLPFNSLTLDVVPDPRQPLPSGKGLPLEIISGQFLAGFYPGSPYLFSQSFYLGSTVSDTYDPSQTFPNNRSSAVSLVFLVDRTATGGFLVNDVTIQNQIDSLVPRAVSYSTAMIDYFFRGNLEIIDVEQYNSTKGKITVKNMSGDKYVTDGVGDAFVLDNGKYSLFVDNLQGMRAEAAVTYSARQVAYGDEIELNYDLSNLTTEDQLTGFDDTPKFTIMYEGKIGTSEAVTGVSWERDGTLLLDLPLSESKQLAQEGSYTSFTWPNKNVQNGTYNIDWKGGYTVDPITGIKQSTKSVSFSGPTARFFGSEGYGSSILVEGKHLFPVSGIVLGAAIRVDQNGVEQLLAVVHDTGTLTDKLVRKPYVEVSNASRDIISGLSMPNQNIPPERAAWELIAELPLGADYPSMLGGERIVSPWFFNGDGSKATTLREKRVFLPFGSNRCRDQSVYDCDDPDGGFPAGDYPVSVLNRYEVSITDRNATFSDKGFKIGDLAELAVDYLDDELLVLNTRNYSENTLANDSNWLYINDTPLLNRDIYDCQSNLHSNEIPLACRPVADTALAATGFPGLHTRWVGTPSNSTDTTARLVTSLHINFVDMRTETFEFSKAITDSVPDRGDMAKVEYWVSHSGDSELLLESSVGTVDCYDDNFLYLSPYGEAAFVPNFFAQEPIPPTRGQYEIRSDCVTIAPINLQTVRGVDRNGTYFAAGRHSFNNSFYNYISTGDDLTQFGILKTGAGTPAKVVAR